MLNQIKTMQINVNMRHLTLEVKQLQATSAATTAAQQHQMRLCCTCNTQKKETRIKPKLLVAISQIQTATTTAKTTKTNDEFHYTIC